MARSALNSIHYDLEPVAADEEGACVEGLERQIAVCTLCDELFVDKLQGVSCDVLAEVEVRGDVRPSEAARQTAMPVFAPTRLWGLSTYVLAWLVFSTIAGLVSPTGLHVQRFPALRDQFVHSMV